MTELIATAPPASRGPAHMIAAGREVQRIIEANPTTWPGLTHYVPDTTGHVVVHYAASRGTATAEELRAPDGVIAEWRAALTGAEEKHAVRYDGTDQLIVVTGTRDGYRVTVIATIIGSTRVTVPALDDETEEEAS